MVLLLHSKLSLHLATRIRMLVVRGRSLGVWEAVLGAAVLEQTVETHLAVCVLLGSLKTRFWTHLNSEGWIYCWEHKRKLMFSINVQNRPKPRLSYLEEGIVFFFKTIWKQIRLFFRTFRIFADRSSTANSIYRFFVGKIRQIDYQLQWRKPCQQKKRLLLTKIGK